MGVVARLRKVAYQLRLYDRALADATGSLARRIAAGGVRLDSATKRKGNLMLSRHGLDGNRPFRSISEGLSHVNVALSSVGIELDDVFSADLFMGSEGRRTFNLALSNEQDPFSPTPISNSWLIVAWYRRESGNYEVTAYLS